MSVSYTHIYLVRTKLFGLLTCKAWKPILFPYYPNMLIVFTSWQNMGCNLIDLATLPRNTLIPRGNFSSCFLLELLIDFYF